MASVYPIYGDRPVSYGPSAAQRRTRAIQWQGLPPGYRIPVVGAEASAETLTEKAKRILGEDNSLLGVKNSTILGVSAAAGLLYYAYTKRWF